MILLIYTHRHNKANNNHSTFIHFLILFQKNGLKILKTMYIISNIIK